MNKIVGELEQFKTHSNMYSIGERVSKIYVYKYMSARTAELCLNSNTLMFSLPSAWKDPYESRFYNADYHKVEKVSSDKRLYACCVTENKLSESAWRMYTDETNEPCVKFCICIGQLRRYLNIFAKLHGATLYEGRINYSLNDSEIDGLHLRSSAYYHSFFDNFGLPEYLNLMLLKRHLFYYEGEIRYMLMGGSLDFLNEHLFIEIPWSMCLSKISIDAQNPADEEALREALEKNSESCMHKYSLQYKPYVPIELENIYKPFKPITIEK